MEEDWDEDLFEDGTVAWARPWDRPWWPAVLFSSWDAARNWTPPAGRTKIRVLGRPEPLQEHEALGYLLGDGSLQVFDKRTYEVQDWDYISPEAVLATTLSNRHCDSSDDESDDGEERDPLRKAFVNAVAEAHLALPLCGRAPDASRRFIDNTPRRGRWPAKKKSRVKKSYRRVNTKPNNAFDIFRVPGYVFSPKTKPKASRPPSQRQASPRMLDVQPAEPRRLPPKKRGRPAGKRPSALAQLVKRPCRDRSPSPEQIVLQPSSNGRVRAAPLKLREAALEIDIDEAAETHKRRYRSPRAASPPAIVTAPKRKPGRPRSGKTLWSVGDRVFSRVPGVGWVHGVVEGVVVGRRLTDDTVTILGDDGVTRDVRAPLARKTAPPFKTARVVSPPGSSNEDSSSKVSDDSSSRSESMER